MRRLSYKLLLLLLIIHTLITYLAIKWVIFELKIDKYFQNNSFPPNSIEEVKKLSNLLQNQKNNQLALRVFHFSGFYFFQTWWIPGTFMFNLLSGSLFGTFEAWVYWVICNTVGGYSWFWLSKHFGQDIVKLEFIQKRTDMLKEIIQQHQDDLFFYLTFMRVFPGAPNWLMNLIFPHIGIPDTYVFFSIFFGLMPWNYFVCEAGNVLSSIKDKSDVVNPITILKLLGIALFILLPPLLKRCCKSKSDQDIEKIKSD